MKGARCLYQIILMHYILRWIMEHLLKNYKLISSHVVPSIVSLSYVTSLLVILKGKSSISCQLISDIDSCIVLLTLNLPSLILWMLLLPWMKVFSAIVCSKYVLIYVKEKDHRQLTMLLGVSQAYKCSRICSTWTWTWRVPWRIPWWYDALLWPFTHVWLSWTWKVRKKA